MTIALITARGGSTRTPRKNLADVCGHPLVAWSIIQARCAKLVDRVFLTTDDDEIAGVGKNYGAEIIRRPVLDNGATAGIVFHDACKKIEAMGIAPDVIITMLPTSCLRKPDELDRMIQEHVTCGAPVTTACPQKETFIFRNAEPFQDRFATKSRLRAYVARQVMGDKFWNYSKMGGGCSVASRDWYFSQWEASPLTDLEIDTRPVDTEKEWHFIPVEEWQTFDIDYPEDLELVRCMFAHYIMPNGGVKQYFEYRGQP